MLASTLCGGLRLNLVWRVEALSVYLINLVWRVEALNVYLINLVWRVEAQPSVAGGGSQCVS